MEIVLDSVQCKDFGVSSKREWLVTNGIGGYASSSVSGANTRRYHGLLAAALKPPTERYVMLSKFEERVQINGQEFLLSCNQYPNAIFPQGYLHLSKFRLAPEPTWEYSLPSDVKIIKKVWMAHGKNTTYITYEVISKKAVRLFLQPLIACKFYHHEMSVRSDFPHDVKVVANGLEIEYEADKPPLRLISPSAAITRSDEWYYRMEHLREAERGLECLEDLYNPATYAYYLAPGDKAVFVATTETGKVDLNADNALAMEQKRLAEIVENAGYCDPVAQLLVRSTDAFCVKAGGRASVIAGYHWFGDWGRDTMISLPGLCLCTKRYDFAKDILTSYIKLLKHGLLPNRFPDQSETPEYNSVDATLWFANAGYEYLNACWDSGLAEKLHGAMEKIVLAFKKGSLYNIHIDTDGLLWSGESGVQLTWMDAKVGTWVVTPRIGKPVEVNALWINLLRFQEWLSNKLGKPCEAYAIAAETAEKAFREKFWFAEKGYYYDVIGSDGPDTSLRPNQLLALSLPFAPATKEQALSVIDVVQNELLTPYGIRTLSPEDSRYVGTYGGTVEQRDGAYHQGTVWAWLLGPFIQAYVKTTGDRPGARRMAISIRQHLREACMGHISEIFDGDPPHEPKGCVAQAWSLAEALRIWVDILGNK